MTTIGIQHHSPSDGTIPAFIRRHPAPVYFALAFAISWGCVLAIIAPSGMTPTPARRDQLFPWVYLAMLTGPSVAGVLMTALLRGSAGLRDFAARLTTWRVGARWYGVALLTAPVTAVVVLLGLSLVSPDFLPGILGGNGGMSLLMFGLAVGMGAGVMEELGWTGFAIPVLRARYGVLATGLLVGVLWGAWHFLVNVWGSGSPSGALSMDVLVPSLFFSVAILPAYRVIMVWVHERTASLLVAVLMHASLTASSVILMPAGTGSTLLIYDLVLAALLIVIAASVAATGMAGPVRGRRHGPAGGTSRCPDIEGHVSPGFESVREAFAENFTRRHELGGACCVYRDGEKVVDIWGGIRNKTTGEPWEEDTMVVVYSATKGLAAMTLALAHSRGWLDYDARVCTYWPEFAQNGKETITVRQLLAHQAGLFAFDEPVDRSVVADLDHLAVVMARQRPATQPGTRQSYHAITLGFYEGELLRRIDPKHRSLGAFFQDEIATPLGLDVYVRLPDSIANSKLALLAKPGPFAMLLHFPPRLTVAAFNHRSNIYRALVANPGSEIVHDPQHVYARNFEVPSGGGVGTARGIARAYGVFATGGRELGLRAETLQALMAPPIPAAHGFYDDGLMGDVRFSLGFMKPGPVWRFGGDGSFGAPGSGGSLGFADPNAGIGYAYVTSQMGTTLTGDPRDVALRDALDAIAARQKITTRVPSQTDAIREQQ